MTWVLVLLGAVLVVLAVPIVLFGDYFEIQATPRGSFLYRTGIPRVMRDLPVTAACDRPVYSHFGRDGERLPYGDVRYASSADPLAILAEAEAHLSENGCTVETRETGWIDMTCGRYTRFVVGVAPGDGCNAVTIELIGEQPWP